MRVWRWGVRAQSRATEHLVLRLVGRMTGRGAVTEREPVLVIEERELPGRSRGAL